ncbi:acetate--CoA ligase family protein [Cytobacillus sp. OWB-43]|uniref:acetate--CoA ligase family protein n=1 Tax=Cytobacillus sp. OWB-43 TaxID=3108468 RepID=UPI002AFFE513|nr:acetate--CoA ligase family protein [Cytobacillus sp. OWB-43]MEA1852300.1 acetate--CoA ligase family protein [Cytobacillus sp. OWB-43]
MRNELKSLFEPESIAIIGCSPDKKKIGGRPLDYLLKYGFLGSIFPVNPNYEMIEDMQCYETIMHVPSEIDLAIIALPQKLVLHTFLACIKKNVKSVVIFSAGFSELGEDGKKDQDQITALAKKHHIRVLGPNCLGLFNSSKRMYATFSTILENEEPLPEGKIGFVSQSGAFGSHVFTLARQHHIGFSHFVATGNESDIDVADCIDYLVHDDKTSVIACYLEGTKDGKKLINMFKLAAQKKKPIVLLKVGKSDVGMQAAMSHTGSMVGSDSVYDTIFKQYGVYRAETIDEFIDVANAFAQLPRMKGHRVAIFTVSGGVGIMLSDQVIENGLTLPETPKEVQRHLKSIIPIAGVKNPLDTTAQVSYMPTLLEDFMKAVLESGQYDAAIVFLGFSGLKPDSLATKLTSLMHMKQQFPDIPCVMVTLCNPEAKKLIHESGMVLNEDPTRAVKILSAMNELRKSKNHLEEMSADEGVRVPLDRINQFISYSSKKALTEFQSKQIVSHYKIPITVEQLALSPTEAVESANSIGYPVVLKGMSPQILHKTEKGLVQLNINSDQEVKEVFNQLKTIIQNEEEAAFDGVLIQEMINDHSIEMYVGAKKDPIFGQMILVGLGGIFIEVFKDVSMRKAPVSPKIAKEMVEELKASQILKGFRGKTQYDVDSLCNLISQFSFVISMQEGVLEEVDLNPIMVFEGRKGVKVADALMKLS